MMTRMYEVFKGQSSGSVTLTLSLTHIPVNVEGEITTNTAIKDPPSHNEGETGEPKRSIPISTIQPTQAQPITTIITHTESSQAVLKRDKGKGIATESDEDLSKRLVPASTIVRPDPDALIPYIINGEVYHLTAKQLQEKIDKKELIKKAEEEARLLAISKPEDAEHHVLKREHTKKVRKAFELRKHKFENYMWTINNRLKPETITDIKIHPKTKPVVIIDNMVLKKSMSMGSSSLMNSEIKHFKDGEILTKLVWKLSCHILQLALVSYLVAASMVKSPENARFILKLKKLIAEHPDQDMLKSKKVKLEALGYEMN
ncbi:hypothetical protein Tco_0201682 [Tanacetum coccineum]